LSRKRGNSHHRELINRDQLEDIAVSFGYAIYHPTEMTVSEQIALFEGASHIAGEYGSALHTSMFSAPGTVITCLRGTSHTAGVLQNGLAKSCGQKVGYIFGESLPENPRQAYKIAEKTFILGMECAELARKIGTFEVFSR
jgi:capsular polysaccharide biosynthesis protein